MISQTSSSNSWSWTSHSTMKTRTRTSQHSTSSTWRPTAISAVCSMHFAKPTSTWAVRALEKKLSSQSSSSLLRFQMTRSRESPQHNPSLLKKWWTAYSQTSLLSSKRGKRPRRHSKLLWAMQRRTSLIKTSENAAWKDMSFTCKVFEISRVNKTV